VAGRIRRLLRLPRSASRIRADIDEELRFDLEMRAADLARQGFDAHTARERALAEFGDLDATQRYCEQQDNETERAARVTQLFEDLATDLGVAWRAMRRSPVFAVVVLATFALGIGADTAVFSVVRRVLITPLPFRAPDRLYRLYTTPAGADGDDNKLSAVELVAIATESRAFSGVAISGNYGGAVYTDAQTAEPWRMASVAPDFLTVLGVRPVLGRDFSDRDIVPGAPRVTLIGFDTWQRVFGGDPRVLERRIQLNSLDYTIAGVLPAGFVMPEPGFNVIDALQPLNVPGIARTARMSRGRAYRGVARLREGVGETALRAELPLLRQRIHDRYPEIKNGGVIRPVSLHAAIVGTSGTVLLLVMFGAVVVLLVACVNIAGLFLARAVASRRELGVRAALGASRERLVRQVLTESALHGLIGGAAGIAIAVVLKRALVALAASALPQLGEVRVDAPVLALAAAVSILCGVAFGVAPAIAATRVDLRETLGDAGGRGASQGRVRVRGSRVLVSAQIAFAVVLLVGAGLLTRTFAFLVQTNLGYTADAHALSFNLNLSGNRYRDPTTRDAVMQSIGDRIRALPGVTAVGYTRVAPWNGGLMGVRMRVVSRPSDGDAPSVEYATASDEYFAALGIPLRAGRVFTRDDRPGSPPTLVISESVARRYWPGMNPVGTSVRIEDAVPGDSGTSMQIVGVVGDVRPNLVDEPVPTLYVSERQWVGYGGNVIVRATGDAAKLAPAIRQLLREVDPLVPLLFPRTLRDVMHASIARQQLAMVLMTGFALLALVLAALGIYGVMAYATVARRREFGIRIAVGATPASIVLLVVRQASLTTLAGVAAGVALAAAGSKYLSSLLVRVSTHDPLTFVGASLALAFVALVASLLPARDATRVQPVDALRTE
jgi:putative ABC transport system permease protein